MRWILIIVNTLLAFYMISQESVITEANLALQKKEFKKAFDLYSSIENSHKGGPQLFHNMALAAAGLGEDAKAILYFEKVLKYKPNNKNIQKDLNLIRKRNPNLEENVLTVFPIKLFNQITGIFSPEVWSVISLIFLLCSCVIIFFHYPFRRIPLKIWAALITSCLLVICTFFIALYRNEQVYHNNGLIIMTPEITLRKSPDNASPEVTSLYAGSKVYKKDQIADWYLVKTENGDSGWISSSSVSKI